MNRSPSRRPLTAGFRFRLGGVALAAPFAVFEVPDRNPVSGADANRQEAFLDEGVPRNPEFGPTNALAGSRTEARPGLRFVC